MKKKILAILLAVCMICTGMPTGVSAAGTESEDEKEYLTLSDFGIEATSLSGTGTNNAGGMYSGGTLDGQTLRYLTDVKLPTDNGQLVSTYMRYGGNNNDWTGISLGFRDDGSIIVHNVVTDSDNNGGILADLSIANLGLDLDETWEVAITVNIVDADSDSEEDDLKATISINGIAILTDGTIINGAEGFGNSLVVYCPADSAQDIRDYKETASELTLSDVGIAEGTYGNDSEATAVGVSEAGLLDKTFSFKVASSTETKNYSAVALYYGGLNSNTDAFMIQLRDNNTIVVYNQQQLKSGVTQNYTDIYLSDDCGIEFGEVYTLGLMLETLDCDDDGDKDDALLHIYVNGVECTGYNPDARYVVDGAATLGGRVHFYGHAGNRVQVWNVESSAIVDKIVAKLENGVLTISGTGSAKKEDIEAVVTDKTTVKEIRLEAGVGSVSSGTFDGFTNLQNVYYANTVQTVAEDAFVNCASGVLIRCIKDKEFTGGLADTDIHPYYSFKTVTIGHAYGEDANTYIWRLAKNYYANLPGRAEGDADYDEIVVAELFTGDCSLAQRVDVLLGNESTTTCYYEKWHQDGTIEINTTPTGPLNAGWMRTALRDEYWDYVILMQSATQGSMVATYEASTGANGKADIDTVIDFAKSNNKNGNNSQYLWFMTWSSNYKVTQGYHTAIANETAQRKGIVESMTTAVQKRVDDGSLDGIIPAGASMEYLKDSWLGEKDTSYQFGLESSTGTYNGGNYSTYFALQRDAAHASAGLGRFALGLTTFSYMADLTDSEILALSGKVYPKSLEEYEISSKLNDYEQATTYSYLSYDEYTEGLAPQAASAAIQAIADPYKTAAVITRPGDADGSDEVNVKDLVRYKNIEAQVAGYEFADAYSSDYDCNGVIDSVDLEKTREIILESQITSEDNEDVITSEPDFIVDVESGREPVVLQLSDTQIIDASQERYETRLGATEEAYWAKDKINERCYNDITETINATKPDLILLTGDLVYGEFDDAGTALIDLIEFMDSFQIPWAPVFGNHENESTKGVDWQCEQLENAEYCLFKQRTLTGNGNYTVGIRQDGELKRVFFMLDSNGCGAASDESMANGHTVKTVGFGADQITWYTQTAEKIKEAAPQVKLSFAFHIQLAAFEEAYAQYGFDSSNVVSSNILTNPVNIDKLENKAESDFGYLGRGLKNPWDSDYSIYNGLKALGVDSIFVGHEHCNSASVVYDGIRFQFGQKTGTYDRANFVTNDGSVYGAYCGTDTPISGGTVMTLSEEDGSFTGASIYLCGDAEAKLNGTYEEPESASKVEGLQYGSELTADAAITVEGAVIADENAWKCTAGSQGKVYIDKSLLQNKTTLTFSVYLPETSTEMLLGYGEFAIRVKGSTEPSIDGKTDGYIDYSSDATDERLQLKFGTWQTFTIDISGFGTACTEMSFVIAAGNTIYLKGIVIE